MYTSDISSWSRMKYCFDIDESIFKTPLNNKKEYQFNKSLPCKIMIEEMNKLHNEGNQIILRRFSSDELKKLTLYQLDKFECKYDELTFAKAIQSDYFVGNQYIKAKDWINDLRPQRKGIIAGAFDIIHPGYIRMFKEAKQNCSHLTVALHQDPSLERANKLRPVQTVKERMEILMSIRYVDNIEIYNLENEFLEMLKNYDIRFLGEDYKDGGYTGKEYPIEIIWLNRKHNFSTTRLKKMIFKSLS